MTNGTITYHWICDKLDGHKALISARGFWMIFAKSSDNSKWPSKWARRINCWRGFLGALNVLSILTGIWWPDVEECDHILISLGPPQHAPSACCREGALDRFIEQACDSLLEWFLG